ncbi:hypothetical protein RD792_004798 [Penstemon davidsonii]|uniref:RRM domain-containing protein n=1 Tax=Penstemon davidsonii TaxID=160366 RepID=A0ABR0DJA3_9LAMI|nr:hypothetical protein RD792_004798 [Penstemon davidsonii]
MSLSTKRMLKPMSMATNASYSVSSLFTTSKASYPQPHLSIKYKPIKLQLSCSYSSSISLISPSSLKKKEPLLRASVVTVQQEEQQDFQDNLNEVEVGEGHGYDELSEEAKLYVGNLPYDVGSEKLAKIFEGAGVVEIAEIIYNRETDQSRGFGFVTMSSVEEAEKAVEMFHRYDLSGRFLTVSKASPKGSRTEQPPRVFEPTSKIYVSNLSWSVDDSRLEQVFSEYGKVVSARVISDRETGRSRGFGFVEMSSESEMNDAIANLDQQSLDGRGIRVSIAQDRPSRNSFLFDQR